MILASTDIVDYPEYQDNHEYKTKGEIIRYDGLYYEIVAPHTSNAAAYPVQTTFAYYRLVELEHAGTLDDPIPYPETAGIVVNVVEGLYYSYKGAVYLAKADSRIAFTRPTRRVCGNGKKCKGGGSMEQFLTVLSVG